MMKNVDSICRYPGSGKVQGLPRPCHRETSKGGCPIQHCSQKNLYLAGGLEHDFYFSIYWEFHHPNSRTHIFQRGRYTTNQIWLIYWIWATCYLDRSLFLPSITSSDEAFRKRLTVSGESDEKFPITSAMTEKKKNLAKEAAVSCNCRGWMRTMLG